MPIRFSRRRFLGIAGGTAAVTIVAPHDVAFGQALTADAATRDPIARLGRAYLSLTPDEDSVDALYEQVPSLNRSQPAVEQLPGLRARVAADFRRRRTVSVDGWRLARTEARVAALHALGR